MLRRRQKVGASDLVVADRDRAPRAGQRYLEQIGVDQLAFEVVASVDCLPRADPHSPADKPLEVLWLAQRSFWARRGDFDRVVAQQIGQVPGALVKIDVEKKGPPTGKPVEITISGDQYDELLKIAEQVKSIVRTIPGVTDLDDDYDTGKPELRIDVDRQRAKLLRLSTGDVAQTLKGAINGIEVGKYREQNEDYDIVVRLQERFRTRIEDIEALTVANPDGDPVPLSAVGRIRYTSGLASSKRKDEKRCDNTCCLC